jgi:transcriptional regulator with XRE-family HTH domain
LARHGPSTNWLTRPCLDKLRGMHPGLAEVFTKLSKLRVENGLSREDVEQELILGKGWVELFETGEREPSLGTLAAILALYNSDLSSFFQGLDFGEEAVIPDRHLGIDPVPGGIDLHFRMGKFDASVHLPGATLDQCNDVLLVLRNALASGDASKAIVKCFLYAVQTWPDLNPSDLWYFFLAHAYQDDFNHPAAMAGKDWAQSWKRAGGWSL